MGLDCRIRKGSKNRVHLLKVRRVLGAELDAQMRPPRKPREVLEAVMKAFRQPSLAPDVLNPMRRALVIGALGVVYGDIGTSPIYTLRQCLKAAGQGAAPEAVLGLLSLVFWSLLIVVTTKYVFLVMRADNAGEGGIMALLGLAAHSEPDQRRRTGLLMLGLAGAALFYGEGMITPAISVLSAVEGLEVATPALRAYVVPIAIVVLVGLFVVQSRGSERIGAFFGPIMAVWFATLAIAGLLQVVQAPSVLAALDPTMASDSSRPTAGQDFSPSVRCFWP